jgi:ferredoxin
MIVANRKPFEHILAMVAPYSKVILLGCNECVTVCAAGGAREVAVLAAEMRLNRAVEGRPIEVREVILERNCDPEYVAVLGDFIEDYEAVLSMACGCGVQFVGERYAAKAVLPAVDTTFEGVTEEAGLWTERCQGCGNCILDKTVGLCPIARCAKSLLNGPCGGSSEGFCEVGDGRPCVWQMIVERLEDRGLMDVFLEIAEPKDWSTARDGGPRKRVREDLRL